MKFNLTSHLPQLSWKFLIDFLIGTIAFFRFKALTFFCFNFQLTCKIFLFQTMLFTKETEKDQERAPSNSFQFLFLGAERPPFASLCQLSWFGWFDVAIFLTRCRCSQMLRLFCLPCFGSSFLLYAPGRHYRKKNLFCLPSGLRDSSDEGFMDRNSRTFIQNFRIRIHLKSGIIFYQWI